MLISINVHVSSHNLQYETHITFICIYRLQHTRTHRTALIAAHTYAFSIYTDLNSSFTPLITLFCLWMRWCIGLQICTENEKEEEVEIQENKKRQKKRIYLSGGTLL